METKVGEIESRHKLRADEQHHSWKVTAKFIETEGLERETVEQAVQKAIENLGDNQ